MKKTICLTALVLAAVMCVFAFTACVENQPENPSDTTAASTVVAESTEAPRLEADVPDSLNFGGKTITFLVMGDGYNGEDWASQDIYAAEETEDPIVTAVYRRNKILEDRYYCVIAEEKAKDPLSTATNAIKSGTDDYQVVMCYTSGMLSLTSNHMLLDLNETNIDLKQPWWDQNMRQNCSIGGKNFFATGDISIMDNDATWVLMFNKAMVSKFDLESPYTLVKNNEWTYDKMYEMMTAVSGGIKGDTNGNRKVDWDADTFGWATHNSSQAALYYAAGLSVVAKDEQDIPYFPTQNTEYIMQVLTKGIEMWTDKSLTWSADRDGYSAVELQQIFQSGRALFLGEVMQLVIRLREMDIDFGLIPYPKFSSDQASYGHFVHSTTQLLGIPITCKDSDNITYFVEAMACESMYTLTPAYYDIALKNKYLRDPESEEMLDIILSSRTFDLGGVYMFNWGSVGSIFTSLLSSGQTTYQSQYDKKIKSATKTMNKAVEKILEE